MPRTDYDAVGGAVFDREEGRNIAHALGDCKAIILQNHGLLTVSPCALPYFLSRQAAHFAQGWALGRRSSVLVHEPRQDMPRTASS